MVLSKFPLVAAVPFGLVALFLTGAAKPAAAQFTITANITGTAPNPAANADIQNALNLLASGFQTNGTASFNLKADIAWTDLGFSSSGYQLGGSQTSSTDFQTVTGASIGDTNDAFVLINNDLDRYRNGAASTVDTSGNYADFTIVLNSNPNVPLDFTMGPQTNPNATNLADIVMHEAIHSMGFASPVAPDGSYGFKTNGGAGVPAPTIWTTKLYDGITQQAFTSPLETDAERSAVMVSGTDSAGHGGMLFFDGPKADAVYNQRMQVYAGDTYGGGQSGGGHMGPDNPAPNNGQDLMRTDTGDGVYITPSALDYASLSDIGWKLAPTAPVPEASTSVDMGLMLLMGVGVMLVARKRKSARKAD